MDATVIWSLRKPLQWVWRKVVRLATAWTIEPIFRQAHDHHLALRNWQRRWIELANGIEYKKFTRSSFQATVSAEQSIWIRNGGETLVDEIHFCVEAKLGNFSYQVPLTVYRLRPGCIVQLALPGLPLQDLSIRRDQIIGTYESMHVYPVRIVRDNHLEIYSTEGLAWHPSYNDHFSGWTALNGRLYNTKAIADARGDCLGRFAHFFCGRYGLISLSTGSLLGQALRTKRYRRIPGILAFAVVSNGPVLHVIHWTRLLLRIERIAFECGPEMRAATEYVLCKGESARPRRIIQLDGAATHG